jgi:glucosamine-phosphate N-acetyltransferase
MNAVIRELQASDLTHCLSDTLSGLAEVGLTAEQMWQVMQERLRAGIRTYIAWDSSVNEVVGSVSLLVERKFIHRGGKVGHVEDVAVRRGYRGKGLGAELVRHATQEARKLGCYKVILSCFEQLAPFYASLGYRKHDIGMRIDLGEPVEMRSRAAV